MKATSLPVNTVIIIVIAVLVLVAVVALFYTGFFTPKEMISTQTAFNNACLKLLNDNCKTSTTTIQTPKFDADKDGVIDETAWLGDNLFMICVNYYQVRCSTQISGDINGDCIVGAGSNDWNAFQTLCNPYWGEAPPADRLFCDCHVDNHIDIGDLGCMNDAWSDTETTAEVACKKLCNCP